MGKFSVAYCQVLKYFKGTDRFDISSFVKVNQEIEYWTIACSSSISTELFVILTNSIQSKSSTIKAEKSEQFLLKVILLRVINAQ